MIPDWVPTNIQDKVKESPCPIEGLKGDCWLWQGALTRGYGEITVNYEHWILHRYVYILSGKDIPEGYTIDHLCRIKACCNPDHMESVTLIVNLMRGTSPSAINKRKTHCKYGHPLTAGNFYSPRLHPTWRICRICHIARTTERTRLVRRLKRDTKEQGRASTLHI